MTVRRDYSGPVDLRAMQGLVQRIWSVDTSWHVGDLAWQRYQHVGREPEWRTALWERDGRLVAWAWLRLPGSLDMVVDPDHAGLVGDVLDWFAATATADKLEVYALASEPWLAAAYAGHGFAPVEDPDFLAKMLHDLADVPEPAVPDGYRVRHVTAGDLAARVAVHRAAFAPSRVTEESYANVMAAWPYRPDLDWVVEAPDGEFAASCLVWLDEVNGVGNLEPVGTHPDHRGRGLGRAACAAAMRAARRAGARTAVVFSHDQPEQPAAPALYRSLGFRPHTRTVLYRRA